MVKVGDKVTLKGRVHRGPGEVVLVLGDVVTVRWNQHEKERYKSYQLTAYVPPPTPKKKRG